MRGVGIPSPRLQVGHSELPELAFDIVQDSAHVSRSDSHRRRIPEWSRERRLDQDFVLAERRKQVLDLPGVPSLRWRRASCIREQISWQPCKHRRPEIAHEEPTSIDIHRAHRNLCEFCFSAAAGQFRTLGRSADEPLPIVGLAMGQNVLTRTAESSEHRLDST